MALTPQMKRRFGVAFFLFLLVFGVVMVTGDFQRNYDEIIGFRWGILPLALFVVFVNFVLRELKWDFFRRRAGIQAPRKASFLIYFSGYSMCVSPGRLGELIKPIMYHEYLKIRLSKTIPLVFCERLTDMLGMLLLCAVTFFPFRAHVVHQAEAGGAPPTVSPFQLLGLLGLSVALLAVLIALARWRRFVYWILNKAAGVARLASLVTKVRSLYDATYPLLTASNLILMTLFAAFSWFFECLATYILSRYGLGITSVTLPDVVFIFCLASIAGGLLIFMPGGAVGFEAIMITGYAMLGASGRVITILCRFSTLFFGVLVGVVSIVFATRYFHKAIEWEELEHIAEEVEAETEAAAADPAEGARP